MLVILQLLEFYGDYFNDFEQHHLIATDPRDFSFDIFPSASCVIFSMSSSGQYPAVFRSLVFQPPSAGPFRKYRL